MPKAVVRAVFVGVFACSTTSALAQFGAPSGTEFRVNSSAGGSRFNPRVGMASDGRFFAVWSGSGSDGSGHGIVGRRFDASGVADGNEFQVNTTAVGDQRLPHIAMNGSGASVVVWQSMGQDGSGWGIYGQRYDAGGGPQGPEFRVNTTVAGDQDSPSVAMDALGRFVVCWRGVTLAGARSVFAQRFDAAGSGAGLELEVAIASPSVDGMTSVAMNGSGRFVVGWSDGTARARRYDELGAALGAPMSVFPGGWAFGIGIADSGAFAQAIGDIVAGPGQVFVYDDTGALQGRSALDLDLRYNLDLAMIGSGDFVISGMGNTAFARPGYVNGVFAQTFGPRGDPREWPFQVNTIAVNEAYYPAVAAGGPEMSVVVWVRTVSPGVVDVLGQRYAGPPSPVPPASFHTLTPCRVIDTRDAISGLSQPLLSGISRKFDMVNACGIPISATAIAANVTVTQPSAAGYLSFWPGAGPSGSPVSTVNFEPGQTRANSAMLPIPRGELRVRSAQTPAATVHFILDVVGYFE